MNANPAGKRIFDIAVSAVGLTLASPVMAAVALAIKLDTPGPVFFRQERVGLGGKTFRIHKFRTMVTDHDGLAISTTADSRVTRTGRFLRRSKLDELPQLLDVFTGHMSLVGPRPEVEQYVRLWPAELREIILSVRPGITDPASIELRNEADILAQAEDPQRHYIEVLLPQKAKLYARYVQSRSFTGDLALLWQTAIAVVAK